jgi:hypothetical protein
MATGETNQGKRQVEGLSFIFSPTRCMKLSDAAQYFFSPPAAPFESEFSDAASAIFRMARALIYITS